MQSPQTADMRLIIISVIVITIDATTYALSLAEGLDAHRPLLSQHVEEQLDWSQETRGGSRQLGGPRKVCPAWEVSWGAAGRASSLN